MFKRSVVMEVASSKCSLFAKLTCQGLHELAKRNALLECLQRPLVVGIGISAKGADSDNGEVNFVDLGCGGGGWFFNGEIFIPICMKY